MPAAVVVRRAYRLQWTVRYSGVAQISCGRCVALLFSTPARTAERALCIDPWCPQAAAQQGDAAVSVRLGALAGPAQAQLDGFKSRVLRAEASTPQQHLYVTEWSIIGELEAAERTAVLMVGGDESMQSERLASSVLGEEMVALRHSSGATVVLAVSTQRSSFAIAPLLALEVALTVMQAQVIVAQAPTVWVLSAEVQEFQSMEGHAGMWGLSRSTPRGSVR